MQNTAIMRSMCTQGQTAEVDFIHIPQLCIVSVTGYNCMLSAADGQVWLTLHEHVTLAK